MREYGLVSDEATEFFEFSRNNDGYWDGAKLLQQVVSKALPIAEALFPGYSLLFLFDNATSHSVYADDALHVTDMNKGNGGKQPWLRNGYFFDSEGIRIDQPMSFQDIDGTKIQKGIQRVLEERSLWPDEGLNLECLKPRCFTCQMIADCRVCTKGKKCDSCKKSKEHSSTKCSKARLCDACVERAAQCQCILKKVCENCSVKKGKCLDCEELPPKCTTNRMSSVFQRVM
jgi:hypothetical protein